MRLIPGSVYRLFFLSVALSSLIGCATSETDQIRQEQSAVIKSLKAEIERLNAELATGMPGTSSMTSQSLFARQKEKLERSLGQEISNGSMNLSLQDKGIVVTVLDRVLFDSGSAELLESARYSLQKVAEALNRDFPKNMIYIEGHTDNDPVTSSDWPSNWELSTARATQVVHFLSEIAGVNPHRLAATGYGEYQPVTSNNTEEGRRENRRVEIVISPKEVSL